MRAICALSGLKCFYNITSFNYLVTKVTALANLSWNCMVKCEYQLVSLAFSEVTCYIDLEVQLSHLCVPVKPGLHCRGTLL